MGKLEILLNLLFSTVVSLFKNHSALAMENLALRQQLFIYHHSKKWPKIRLRDRLFWILVSRYWEKWENALIIVKPETVIGWHRKGFKLFWTWKSRKRGPGRPKISIEIRNLIKTMANENPTWGAPRIHGELLALGFEIDETTVSNYLKRFRTGKPPSQAWRTFLANWTFFSVYRGRLYYQPPGDRSVTGNCYVFRALTPPQTVRYMKHTCTLTRFHIMASNL